VTTHGVEALTSRSVAQTLRIGRELAARLAPGDCVALTGPLGAGKTALARGIATGLGLADERLVASPTYVLVHEYPTTPPLYHLDLYRMGDATGELADLGLDEMLEAAVVLIEWADRAAGALPTPRWEVAIGIAGRTRREIAIRRVPQGPPSETDPPVGGAGQRKA
jgi:tRNA threonylcarbamoyl adenosine modification protein YjeE